MKKRKEYITKLTYKPFLKLQNQLIVIKKLKNIRNTINLV